MGKCNRRCHPPSKPLFIKLCDNIANSVLIMELYEKVSEIT